MPANKTYILQYNNKKNEEIEFHNDCNHLQKFGFVWEYPLLDCKNSIELSKGQKKLKRKRTLSKRAGKNYLWTNLEYGTLKNLLPVQHLPSEPK